MSSPREPKSEASDLDVIAGSPSTPEQKTAAVRAALLDVGFDAAGVASANAELFGAAEVASSATRVSSLPFLAESVASRTDIRQFLPGAASVVVALAGYYAGDHQAGEGRSGSTGGGEVDPDLVVGKVSRYAWGADYHNVLRKRLRRVRKRLVSSWGGTWAPFCDVDPVLDRAWAAAAGLGFVGKSAMLIHRELGTWTFIAGLVTDVELAPTGEGTPGDLCGTCTACLDACPTSAFEAPWKLDPSRCLTTWTIERPHDEDQRPADLSNPGWAAGCDVCQEVCPWNRKAPETREVRFHRRPGHDQLTGTAVPDDEELSGTPLARAGSEGLLRSLRWIASSRDRGRGEE